MLSEVNVVGRHFNHRGYEQKNEGATIDVWLRKKKINKMCGE